MQTLAESKRRWQNQNLFLQDRHGPDKASPSPEMIAVELPSGNDRGFDLLCWTINMAARPGDSIVAFRQQHYDAMHKFIAGHTYKPAKAVDAEFKPLQDLCDVKQVHLGMRVASNDVTEKLLVEEVSAMKATMLVVTTSGHHLLRHAQRRGSFLCRQVPAGCSVVVVKDYKVLLYQENHFRAASVQRGCPLADEDGSLQIQTTPITVSETETHYQLDTSIISCNKVWPESMGTCSPKRVLDGSDAFYDSDDSPDHTGLSRSLSRKSLVSCAASLHDEDDIIRIKPSHSCLRIWRGSGRVHRSLTFPSACRSKRAPIFTHCKSLGNSFKSYMSSLWIARPLKSDSTNTPLNIAEKPWKIFTYEDISKATNLFSPGNLVGKGGHSEVYKGLLPDGQLVAVKRLIRSNTGELKTIDFLTELGMICHISHPNITPLVGFCIEKGLHLIFHFLCRGSLASWLHGGRLPTLKWAIRYRVAVGTARGLNYLHSDCQRRIIHRDIKASNILLGPDFEPQISDFGLAKWLPDQCSHHISTPIEGTFGYLAPEYFMHGILDEKTDVFAFGVLLLELITGRKPIEGLQSSLVMWARPFLEVMNVEALADTRLNGEYDPQEMQCMMMAAALCVQQSPQCRPWMSQVLQLLTDEISSDRTGSLSVLSSQSFCLQDPSFDSDYSSIHYHNDLRRHREIALQF